MAHSSGSGGLPFPRWQIAFALGATGAIGLGYWYMRQSSIDKTKKLSKSDLLEFGKKSCSSVDEGSDSKSATNEKSPLRIALEYKSEGNDYFKNGQYDKAIACYSKAIEECPIENSNDLATFYQNRAAAYEQLKKYSSVIDDCSKALEFKSNYIKALYRRAKAYESAANWSDCLDDVSALCLLQGFQDQSALIMADRVLKELGRSHAAEAIKNRVPITPSKHFVKTYFLSFTEDPAYNLIISDALVVTESDRGFLRAKKAFLSGNYDEIINACTEEIDNSEAESQYKLEAVLLRATFYLLRGCHEKALADLDSLISNELADFKLRVSALIKRASMHMQLEKPEECINDFNKAAELGPDVSDVYHHRGQVNLLMDRTDEATKDFDRAVELNPNFPIAYVQKCYSDYRQALNSRNSARVEKCMSNFVSATERFPKCSECFILYAQVLADQQQYNLADEFYDKALAIDSSNATVYVHKGLLQLQWNGDIDKAVSLMNTAITRDPLCEFAFETLATVEVQRQNLQNAVDLFDKAIKLAKTELELTHLFSLRDAAMSQLKISKKLGISSTASF